LLFLCLTTSRISAALSFISSTIYRSISSIFLLHSSIVIWLALRLCDRLPYAQCSDKVFHGLRRISPMLLDDIYDGAADHRCFGKLPNGLELLRIGDAESNGNR